MRNNSGRKYCFAGTAANRTKLPPPSITKTGITRPPLPHGGLQLQGESGQYACITGLFFVKFR